MTLRRALPWLVVGLAIVVWAVPLQFVGWYDNGGITDIPTYREAYEHIASGQAPYLDFSLEYPPLAAGLFWLAGVLPGQYEVGFSILMLICLCATALGVLALARTLGLDQRRQALAAGAVAVSPLLLGNLVETRFDLALAALLTWTLWAAASGRFRLAWGLLAGATLLKLIPLALVPVLLIWQRHREGARAAWAGLAWCALLVAVVIVPFAVAAPSGTWDIARYHIDRPLQIESTGGAYLLGLHALADVPLTVVNSFGSQGLKGSGPAVIAGISTAVLVGLIAAVAWSLWVGLRRARPPGDARLFVAASCCTIVAAAGGRQGAVAPVHALAAAGRVPGGRPVRLDGLRRRGRGDGPDAGLLPPPLLGPGGAGAAADRAAGAARHGPDRPARRLLAAPEHRRPAARAGAATSRGARRRARRGGALPGRLRLSPGR